jgi:hypothetical protein
MSQDFNDEFLKNYFRPMLENSIRQVKEEYHLPMTERDIGTMTDFFVEIDWWERKYLQFNQDFFKSGAFAVFLRYHYEKEEEEPPPKNRPREPDRGREPTDEEMKHLYEWDK